ncbi:hypothetical protein FPV67DRAFT_1435919 [Lyophyllum atratum]|nr:hypothetical protein FPV67DRAFT_1435919 [Lyophyllum atratum]
MCRDVRTDGALRNLLPCPGVRVYWDAGSIWDTYPYSIHAVRDVGWVPIALGDSDRSIQLRAENCEFPTTGSDGFSCSVCLSLRYSQKFSAFIAHAEEANAHTPWDYLTPKQRKALMKKMALTIKQLRTKVSNAHRRLATASRRMADNSRIMMMLANNDFPSLQRLLSVALRRGASADSIIQKLQLSLDGLYSPRGGYTDRDLDIAFIAKALGGQRLLYALQKAKGLPSERTVRRRCPVPKLLASIGIPSSSEIDANINAFLNPTIFPPPPSYTTPRNLQAIPGNILMFDGVALEGRCRYCPRRDVVLGLCREHSHSISLKCETIEVLESLRDAIAEGKLCLGSDATVVAIAPYGRSDHYSPVPLVLSPSDKTERGEALKGWIETLLQRWELHENGAKLHGPIWALGSDGDSSFRVAKHLLCMVEDLDLNSDLGKKLRDLPGLNLKTSKGGVTGTCDPKHIFKRFATLLRSPNGITVFNDHLTTNDILQQLCYLPGMTREKARQLLDPSDKQNVPKAVSLIQHLLKLEDLPTPAHPSEARHRHSVVFVAKMLGYFLLPFISVDMTLSVQIKYLATYSHLATAMYLKHGTACMTGALYHDTQSVVKNIVFTVARMQLIDPDLPFHMILEGTDRLEQLFGDCRTQDHARNFDIEQLGGKLSTAALLNAAFQRNPELDRGHRRLSLKDAMGIDHVNPRSWIGDVHVGGVNLQTAWKAGHQDANDFLREWYPEEDAGIHQSTFNTQERDFLRPLKDYVGVRAQADDERDVIDSVSRDSLPSQCLPIHDDEGGVEELGLDIDDYFPPTPEEIENAEPSVFDMTLQATNGKTFYKSSLVALLCSERGKKVTMRTLRARGVALEDLQKRVESLDQIDLDGVDLIKSGDIASVLVRSASSVSLAAIEVTGFKQGADKTVHFSVDIDSLDHAAADVTVLGQILELKPHSMTLGSWQWTGNYLKIESNPGDKYLTRRHLVLELPGPLVFPLAPSIIPLPSSISSPSPLKVTWGIDNKQLSETFATAWDALEPSTEDAVHNVAQLPIINNQQSIPYRDAQGNISFTLHDLPEHLRPNPKLTRLSKVECFFCTRYDGDRQIVLHKMREHVGKHILCAMRGVKEKDIVMKQEIGVDPCGFCGQDKCITTLKYTHKGSAQLSSNCPYYYENMRYVDPINTSNKPKCTNTPIQCAMCPTSTNGTVRTVWKYNAHLHMITEHALMDDDDDQEEGPEVLAVPAVMIIDMFISQAEETFMGMTKKETLEHRAKYDLLNSDGFEEAQQTGKRDRSATITLHPLPRSKRPRSGTLSEVVVQGQ